MMIGWILLFLVFWGVVIFFIVSFVWNIWRGYRGDRENQGLPFKGGSISPKPAEPSNSDIMKRLEIIENGVDSIEAQTKKIQKSIKDVYGWLWAVMLGGLLALFWDDIVAFLKLLFSFS